MIRLPAPVFSPVGSGGGFVAFPPTPVELRQRQDELEEQIADVRKDDGSLQDEVVTFASLSPEVAGAIEGAVQLGTPADATVSFSKLTTDIIASQAAAEAGTEASSLMTPLRTAQQIAAKIGTQLQAFDAELAAIAGLTSAADRLPYFTGSGTAALATFTAAGRALLDDVSASDQRTTLGATSVGSSLFTAVNEGAGRTALQLGSLATLSSVNNGNWSGTDLAIANGGTGASDAATAVANLGLTRRACGMFLTSNQTLSSATTTLLTFDRASTIGNDGNWNTSTYRYTPPAGNYRVTLQVHFDSGLVSGQSVLAAIRVNGSNYAYRTDAASVTGTLAVDVSCIVNLNGTDYLEAWARADGTGNKVVSSTGTQTFIYIEAI